MLCMWSIVKINMRLTQRNTFSVIPIKEFVWQNASHILSKRHIQSKLLNFEWQFVLLEEIYEKLLSVNSNADISRLDRGKVSFYFFNSHRIRIALLLLIKKLLNLSVVIWNS